MFDVLSVVRTLLGPDTASWMNGGRIDISLLLEVVCEMFTSGTFAMVLNISYVCGVSDV